MSKTLKILYKTDKYHTNTSRELLGVFDNLNDLAYAIETKASQEDCLISSDDWTNLQKINQTQGYDGEGEFFIELISLNELV